MKSEMLTRLNDLRSRRIAAVLFTDVDSGAAQLFAEGEAVDEHLKEAFGLALRKGTSALITAENRQLFVNVYLPPVKIVVIGAAHISQALAPMARLAGFDLKIIDPRSAFATPERFPDTELVVEWPQDVLDLDAYTAVVAVSHVPDIDDFPLMEALKAGCFYVGALGSRKSHAGRLARLRERGADEAALERIRAPIGLDIGAATPAEIAVSILAEIVQSLRRRDILPTEGVTA